MTTTHTGTGRAAPSHTHPRDVPLTTALAALSDPVRLTIVRELSNAPEWQRTCGSFNVPVGKAALSHHFAVLREAGVIEQRDEGPTRVNRLRRPEFDRHFPGLIDLVLRPEFNRPAAPHPLAHRVSRKPQAPA